MTALQCPWVIVSASWYYSKTCERLTLAHVGIGVPHRAIDPAIARSLPLPTNPR